MPDTQDPMGEVCEAAVAALEGVSSATLIALGDNPAAELRPVVDAILAEAAAQQWIANQLAETGLRSMDFRNGGTMEFEPAREMVAAWIGAARAMLGDAPNYTENDLGPDQDDERLYGGGSVSQTVKVAESVERYAFILQRVGPGYLTPHEARLKADRERDAILAEVSAWVYAYPNSSPASALDLVQALEQAGHTVPTQEV